MIFMIQQLNFYVKKFLLANFVIAIVQESKPATLPHTRNALAKS